MSITSKFLLAATVASLTACIPTDNAPNEAIQRAIPTSDQVSIKLPDNKRTIGQLAEFYVTTRDITRTFNGGAGFVLVLVHEIVQHPATTVEGNTYTWGPFSDALDPAEYQLVVVDNGDETYEWTLSGRSKLVEGAQMEAVISGLADSRAGENLGSGAFKLDFDAGRRVNEIDSDPNARGTVEVVYDLAEKALAMHIETVNELGAPFQANYLYNEGEAGDGEMVFGIEGDMGGGPELEAALIHSRWLGDGAGRADIALKGGNTAEGGALASECWDIGFKRSFFAVLAGNDNGVLGAQEGDQATCVFADAQMPEEP